MDEDTPTYPQTSNGLQTINDEAGPEQANEWLSALDVNDDVVDGANDGAVDVNYSNQSAAANAVPNSTANDIDRQTSTGASTTDVFRTESFRDATGCTAGAPVGSIQIEPQNADDDVVLCDNASHTGTGGALDEAPPPFYPFSSEAEYAQVMWWVRYGTSDGAINEWLNDIRLQPIFAPHFSCRNAKDVKDRLLRKRLQSESKQLQWMKTTIAVEGQRLVVRHRNALEVVSLLIGHGPFQGEIVFSPVRQYSATGSRIYDELHTAEWWWDAQCQLPPGATVVPIILASDKTLLTQQAGGKTAWPLYLSIGNLKLSVRRSVARPGLILLGYLPVHLPGDRSLQMSVLHKAITAILKRMLQWQF
jgi:hypothetical protein